MPTTFPQASPERAAELKESLEDIRRRVVEAAAARKDGRPVESEPPRLVAVSKLKAAEDIMACYELGQRDFGENYAAELAEKAKKLPQDIRWHFIGGLQSNKCKPLAVIPNIWAVQTVDSIKKASALNKALPEDRTDPLHIYLQVNTSGEDNKSGVAPLSHTLLSSSQSPSELEALAKHVIHDCPRLKLLGLMTIGSYEASTEAGEENPDFRCLIESKDALEERLGSGGDWGVGNKLELSMGMSADFEQAIKVGSGSVRVGTGIFGSRPPRA
ncbi:hypothetical protein FRB95_010929 [Tulasnella sp. JGI-2019a]|nr:hypothetical protein FRB95_010929 [Tulasnella sp. JGI-2019a]